MPNSFPNRSAELTRQLAPTTLFGAAAITAMVFASVEDPWTLALGLQLALLAFNGCFVVAFLPRAGLGAELFRQALSALVTVVVSREAGWPTAVWLWPAFAALSAAPMTCWVPLAAALGMGIPLGAAAIRDGVDWTLPLGSLAFALFCCESSRVRHRAMAEMLHRSDGHRAALVEAHASVQLAHAQLEQEVASREQVELVLRSAQKLEAIGRLASGIAHEINTPVQFVGDSVHFVRDGVTDLLKLIRVCTEIRRIHEAGGDPSAQIAALAEAEEEADLPYLTAHLPAALDRALDGVSRVAAIVRSMKQFAHPEQKEMTAVDLNQAIETTLIIAKHEYKHFAEVETHLAPLPFVICHPGEVNQVLLNILVNAAHAIGDVVEGTGTKGRITIRSSKVGDMAAISISDTGGGIPLRIQDKIFEPFFTTKEVGRGTGQGLALARSIIDRHRGRLSFETEPGRGTTFTIQIPIGTSQTLANVA